MVISFLCPSGQRPIDLVPSVSVVSLSSLIVAGRCELIASVFKGKSKGIGQCDCSLSASLIAPESAMY